MDHFDSYVIDNIWKVVVPTVPQDFVVCLYGFDWCAIEIYVECSGFIC